jgi:hypothetical protein
LFEGRGQEMHQYWLLLSGRKKSCVGEEMMLKNNWTIIVHGLFQFDGEF